MKTEEDFLRDISEIRSMMERSSKFLSLSGWAGIMAGIYALAGSFFAYDVLNFNPQDLYGLTPGTTSTQMNQLIVLGGIVLFLAVATALFLSARRAGKKNEKVWNATSRRLLVNISLPLITGGLVMLLFLGNGLWGMLIPFSLIFYGLAIFNAGNFTFRELKFLGIIQVVLGLTSLLFIRHSLLFWAVGFGLMHIIYGAYIYTRYQQ